MPYVTVIHELMARFVNDCLQAEVLWTLKSVTAHFSYKSSNGLPELFRSMFPDSDIARQFSLSERKSAYLCCFVTAPYFRELLTRRIRDKPRFVLLFDESLKKKMKSKQLDVHVRLWTADGQISTHYLTSAFLGHATAEDLMDHFETCTEGLNLGHLQQVSMDGPKVNLKFHRLLMAKFETEANNILLDVGTCGLHVVHGALKDGAARWHMAGPFRSF